MLHRLANVIYWTASAVAALIVVLGLAYAPLEPNGPVAFGAGMAAVGAAIWLAGRAARYILAGR